MTDLVDEFLEVDEGLRVLAKHRTTSYEIDYIRDDLQGQYSDSYLRDSYRSLMGNQATSADFGKEGVLGDLVAQQYVFENVIMFQLPAARYEGLFVSYDRTDDFPINAVLEKADRIQELL